MNSKSILNSQSTPAGGVSRNMLNRPAIVSQLHTPLLPRTSKTMETETTPGMAAVRRETIAIDPLGSNLRSFSAKETPTKELSRYSSEQRTVVESPQASPISPSHISHKSKNIEALTSSFMAVDGENASPMNTDVVPQNIYGLSILAKSCMWKDVVELSSKLLREDPTSTSTTEYNGISVFLKLRWEGLFHMKMFDELSSELSRIQTLETRSQNNIKTSSTSTSTSITTATSNDNTHESESEMNIYNTNKNINKNKRQYTTDSIILVLLQSEVKVMTGQADDAIEQLFKIREIVLQIISNTITSTPTTITTASTTSTATSTPSVDMNASCVLLWRTWTAIVNALIRQRYWRRALAELVAMLENIRHIATTNTNTTNTTTSNPTVCKENQSFFCAAIQSEIAVLCRLSRTLLQIGALRESVSYVEEAKILLERHNDIIQSNDRDHHHSSSHTISDHVLLAEGVTLFGRDKYEEATILFQGILNRQIQLAQSSSSSSSFSSSAATAANVFDTSSSGSSTGSATAGSAAASMLFEEEQELLYLPSFTLEDDSLMAAAASNLAICALNLRELPRAVDTLEKLIRANPVRNMLDPVVFNLCTMYDLSCAPDVSNAKKRVLQRIAVLYHVDDLHWRSFRLS
eukprot:gene1936-3756_t